MPNYEELWAEGVANGGVGGASNCHLAHRTQSREVPHIAHGGHPAATPRRGGHWGLHVLRFHMYEAAPEGPGRPDLKREHY